MNDVLAPLSGPPTSRRSQSMSTTQRPQFTMFSNTTQKQSPFRRITARVRAHFDSSTEAEVTRRSRSHTHSGLHHRGRLLSDGHGSRSPPPAPANTYPRGFRRAGGTHPSAELARSTCHPLRGDPDAPGQHDLWMGSRATPRLGLRTPRPLAPVGRRRYPAAPKSRPSSKLDPTRPPSRSTDSLSDEAAGSRPGYPPSATSSFVMLDPQDAASFVAPGNFRSSSSRYDNYDPQPIAQDRNSKRSPQEWVIRNGRRHLHSQALRGVKQERRNRKEAEIAGDGRRQCAIPYPVDYSPETLANHALGHLLNPDLPRMRDDEPERCLDLGCGGGEWIRDAMRVWPTCEFVGMDIVLLHRGQLADSKPRKARAQHAEKQQRVSWVKGDFLADPLPFPASSFDYVHLRDVSRAIPQRAWTDLMAEVGRILRPGGVMDLTVEDIIFPTLPRSMTASPTQAEITAYMKLKFERGRGLSGAEADARPSGLSMSDGPTSAGASRGTSGETVRHLRNGLPIEARESGTSSRARSSEGSSRRRGSTAPSETLLQHASTPKPRSRSRDMFRGAFSDGEGVRAGLGRILGTSKRSAVSPSRNGDATPSRSPIHASFFIPCVSTTTLQETCTAITSAAVAPGSGYISQQKVIVPGVRVSMDETRATPAASQAALGLGVPSFTTALSSAAHGSVLSLRSIDGSAGHAARSSSVSLHPGQLLCSRTANPSVVSFQGLLSPPLTPPRRELVVPEINASAVSSDLVLDSDEEAQTEGPPALGHDYQLLEQLFCAVYTRRGIHMQPTTVVPELVRYSGAFESVDVHGNVTVPMPHCRSQPASARSPPTPDTSPKSGLDGADAYLNRCNLTLKHALQGVLSVREPMWEELVLRRDLADSPDERVRHERIKFDEMVSSYARVLQSIIDTPSALERTAGWRRPEANVQSQEMKWASEESHILRAGWAEREAIRGLAGYSTFSRRARSIIAIKAAPSAT